MPIRIFATLVFSILLVTQAAAARITFVLVNDIYQMSEQMGADGNWQAWIEDPDGHRIELMQMMPDSLQAKAIARMAAGG